MPQPRIFILFYLLSSIIHYLILTPFLGTHFILQYVKLNKEEDKDWFHIECNKTGTRWTGTCWYFYDQIRYEFDLEFEIPVAYPSAAPELKLPQLEGLTSKMYRGGKICQTVHFQPLWAKNVPRFGIAHSLALSVSCNILSFTFLFSFLFFFPFLFLPVFWNEAF